VRAWAFPTVEMFREANKRMLMKGSDKFCKHYKNDEDHLLANLANMEDEWRTAIKRSVRVSRLSLQFLVTTSHVAPTSQSESCQHGCIRM